MENFYIIKTNKIGKFGVIAKDKDEVYVTLHQHLMKDLSLNKIEADIVMEGVEIKTEIKSCLKSEFNVNGIDRTISRMIVCDEKKQQVIDEIKNRANEFVSDTSIDAFLQIQSEKAINNIKKKIQDLYKEMQNKQS